MSLLAKCAPSRWGDFLDIPNDYFSKSKGKDQDLFVGQNATLRITLTNGTVSHFRDVVIWGDLIIRSSNPENIAHKPSFIVRDFFAPGHLHVENVDITNRRFHQHKNTDAFRQELQDLFIKWIRIQRQYVNDIGLKSILV